MASAVLGAVGESLHVGLGCDFPGHRPVGVAPGDFAFAENRRDAADDDALSVVDGEEALGAEVAARGGGAGDAASLLLYAFLAVDEIPPRDECRDEARVAADCPVVACERCWVCGE